VHDIARVKAFVNEVHDLKYHINGFYLTEKCLLRKHRVVWLFYFLRNFAHASLNIYIVIIKFFGRCLGHVGYIILKSYSTDLFDLAKNYLARHLSKIFDGYGPQYGWLHQILSSLSHSQKMLFVELVQKQGLPPEILEEEKFIKFEVI